MSCLHGIRNQSFRWLKLGRKVPFLMQCATILNFCSSESFFSYWGAEELYSLLKKAVTFGGKVPPQLDLHWPGYHRHPCSSFSPHSFFHSLIPDTFPMPSHLSKMVFIILFADPTSCASRGSFSLSKHSCHIAYSRDSLTRLQKGFPLLFKERRAYHYLILKGNLCFDQGNN